MGFAKIFVLVMGLVAGGVAWGQTACEPGPWTKADAYRVTQGACAQAISERPTQDCTCEPYVLGKDVQPTNTRYWLAGDLRCEGGGGGQTWGSYYDECTGMSPGPGSGPGGPPCLSACCSSGGSGNGASGSEKKKGSIIDLDTQSLGEEIPLVGVPFSLMYNTMYVQDREGFYKLRVPISSNVVDAQTTAFNLKIINEASAVVVNQNFTNAINQEYNWIWNGNLNGGSQAWGSVPFKILITETLSDIGPIESETIVKLGNFKAIKLGLGHWMPSIYKFYDVLNKRLIFPNGNMREIEATLDSANNLYKLAASDASELYEFDLFGRLKTVRTGITGQVRYQFFYDGSGRLSSIQDGFGNTTTFNRNGSGVWTSITTPYNKTITVTVDVNSRLTEVIYPSLDKYEATYHGATSLIATFKKPNLATSSFTYDALGNLTQDAHSGGFVHNLLRIAHNEAVTEIEYSTSDKTNVVTLKNDLISKSRTVSEPSKGTKSVTYQENYNAISPGDGSGTATTMADDLRFGPQARRITDIHGSDIGFYYRPQTFAESVTLTDPADPFSISAWTKTDTVGSSTVNHVYNPTLKKWTSTTALGKTSNYMIDAHERIVQTQQGSLNAVNMIYTGDKLTQVAQGTRTTTYSYSPSTGSENFRIDVGCSSANEATVGSRS